MKTKQMEVFLINNIRHGFETVSLTDMEGCEDYVLLGSGMATINMLPNGEVTQAQIDALNASKQSIQAKCQVEIESIDDRIQSLLAIGHDGEDP